MPFLVKAVASALKQHPVINASIDEEGNEIIYKEYVNIGIAVDTERGLVVPVLRDADRKSIPQIARELADLAESARSGSFTVDDLRGGTFTISNLGAIGGTYSTPIINPPEVAILLVGRSRMLPQYIGIKTARIPTEADDAAVDHLRPPHRRRRRSGAVPERREEATSPTRAGCCWLRKLVFSTRSAEFNADERIFPAK